jgi:hypothetical protein
MRSHVGHSQRQLCPALHGAMHRVPSRCTREHRFTPKPRLTGDVFRVTPLQFTQSPSRRAANSWLPLAMTARSLAGMWHPAASAGSSRGTRCAPRSHPNLPPWRRVTDVFVRSQRRALTYMLLASVQSGLCSSRAAVAFSRPVQPMAQ